MFAFSAECSSSVGSQRMSDGDGDQPQPHAGQRLAQRCRQRLDVGHVAFNRQSGQTRSRLLCLQTSSRSSATNPSMAYDQWRSPFPRRYRMFFARCKMQHKWRNSVQHCTAQLNNKWSECRSCRRRHRLTDSVAALHACAPYLVWLVLSAAVAVSVIITVELPHAYCVSDGGWNSDGAVIKTKQTSQLSSFRRHAL